MGTNMRTLADLRETNDTPNYMAYKQSWLGQSPAYEDPDKLRCIDLFIPGFKLNSFIFYLSVFQVIVYIISLFFGSLGLAPSHSTLKFLGASSGIEIQNGQIWRLVFPIFLHTSIYHLAFNMYAQLILGTTLEKKYGVHKFILLYFLSGIGGNLLSVALLPCKTAVGASTSGFGLLGMEISEVLLNWKELHDKERVLCNLVIIFFFMTFLIMGTNNSIDWAGHLGGFIIGSLMVVPLNGNINNQWPYLRKYGLKLSILLIISFYIATTAVIFGIPMSKRCVI